MTHPITKYVTMNGFQTPTDIVGVAIVLSLAMLHTIVVFSTINTALRLSKKTVSTRFYQFIHVWCVFTLFFQIGLFGTSFQIIRMNRQSPVLSGRETDDILRLKYTIFYVALGQVVFSGVIGLGMYVFTRSYTDHNYSVIRNIFLLSVLFGGLEATAIHLHIPIHTSSNNNSRS